MKGLPVRRAALLVLSMLSGCAANDFGFEGSATSSRFTPTGTYGAYLTGRFAAKRADLDTAADKLGEAARASGLPEVVNQAFTAAVLAGRADASVLAATLPDNPVAQLVLADRDAIAGRWADAEARFAGLPQQGLTQVLRPMLMAWAQAGAGRTAAALSTLAPVIESGRLRGVMALHGAMIADLGGQTADAARLYRVAQAEYGGLNLRLGIVLASWQARTGNVIDAQRTIREVAGAGGELGMARLSLEADVSNRAVRNATDGLAEAYLALGATLRQQDAADTAQILVRLALAVRPDFTAARLLLSDMQTSARRPRAALETLASVPNDDPLIAMVRLRQAGLHDSVGETEVAAGMLDALGRQYPDRPEPLAQAGEILRRTGHYPEAVAMMDRAIARVGTPSRQNWLLFYERGIALERAGNWPKAEADFQFALELAPEQPNVLNYLGYAWTERGQNLVQARQMIERAVQQRPNDGSFIDSLGWVLLRAGDAPGALKNMQRAVELQPEDAVINGHLGDAMAAMGRWREAEYQWRRALLLKPDPEDAERINQKLSTLPQGRLPTQASVPAATVR